MIILLLTTLYSCGLTLSDNIIVDYAKAAEINETKVGFFYNQIDGTYTTLNQSDLNKITNYMTIGSLDQILGSCIKYYEYPRFQTVKSTKNITEQWLGARIMNQQIIDEWLVYAHLPMESPTNAWKIIMKKCFAGKILENEIELYQYSALVPSVKKNSFLYTFSWKIKNIDKDKDDSNICYQATYSLTYNMITCQDYTVDCNPPF